MNRPARVIFFVLAAGIAALAAGYALNVDLAIGLRRSANLLDDGSSIDAQAVAEAATRFYSHRGVRYLAKKMDDVDGEYGDVALVNLLLIHEDLATKAPLSKGEAEVMALLEQSGFLQKCSHYAAHSRRDAIQTFLARCPQDGRQ